MATNRDLPGDEVIWRYRARCGKSEEAHAVIKDDLTGRTPALGPVRRQTDEGIRFALIVLPGRVMRRSRRLIIRSALDHPGLDLLLAARRRFLAVATRPDLRATPLPPHNHETRRRRRPHPGPGTPVRHFGRESWGPGIVWE